jgi:hypothetical protein
LSGEIASAVSPIVFKNGGLIRILERVTAKNWYLIQILGAKARCASDENPSAYRFKASLPDSHSMLMRGSIIDRTITMDSLSWPSAKQLDAPDARGW